MNFYFANMLLSYGFGSLIFVVLAYKDKRPLGETIWVLLIILTVALLGSKWAHVFFEARGHLLSTGEVSRDWLELLANDPWHGFRFLDPGYVFYGGLFSCWFLTQINPKLESYSNYAVPGLCLGIFWGRVGCYYTGCCFGVGGFPVQLLDAGFGLFMLLITRKFSTFIVVYSLWRFGIEFLRADESRGIWMLGLSTSQWIALTILTIRAKSSHMRQIRI